MQSTLLQNKLMSIASLLLQIFRCICEFFEQELHSIDIWCECSEYTGDCAGKACVLPDDQVRDGSVFSSWSEVNGVPSGNVCQVFS